MYNNNGLKVTKIDDGLGNLSMEVVKGTEVQTLPYTDGQKVNAGFSDGSSYDITITGNSASVTDTTVVVTPPGTMHLIMFGDTLDPSIGAGVICCQRDIEALFTNAAAQAGMTIQKYIYRGNDFNRTNLDAVLQNLTCNANDAVIFYYDGHGFRYDNQTEKWNQLSLGMVWDLQSALATSKGSYEVYTALKAKGARLTLVFADCCNNKIGFSRTRSRGREATFMRAISSQEHYARLFNKAQGSGIITTSSPGEFASGSDTDSRFSVAFTDAFNDEVNSSNPSPADWVNIYSKSKTAVMLDASRSGDSQTPMYESNIIYNP